jgi:hypothetical protein
MNMNPCYARIVLSALFALIGSTVGCSTFLAGGPSEVPSNGAGNFDSQSAIPLQKIAGPRKKTLVLSFWNDTPVGDQKLGQFAASELQRELAIQKAAVIPEASITAAVTQDFIDGDRVRVAQLIREGRKAGVSIVIIGRIGRVTFRHAKEDVGVFREAESLVSADVEMKIFDAVGGREVHHMQRTGTSVARTLLAFQDDQITSREARAELAQTAIRDAIVRSLPEALVAMEKIDWQGRIAKIVGSKVYVNAGRKAGILAGDILKVLSPGEDIFDPVSKAFLGRSEGLLKGALEVSEFVGEDSAMATIHSGGNFQEGDLVRLY